MATLAALECMRGCGLKRYCTEEWPATLASPFRGSGVVPLSEQVALGRKLAEGYAQVLVIYAHVLQEILEIGEHRLRSRRSLLIHWGKRLTVYLWRLRLSLRVMWRRARIELSSSSTSVL